MATVSIILPTYNSRRIIQPTLDSVFRQTFTDYELLIVDDGSIDNTLDYLHQLDDPRVKIYTYPNAGVGGPSVSRNRGLALATGDYIAHLNHDDLWTPDKLEKQLAALRQTPEARVAYSWLDHIDADGTYLHPGSQSPASGDVLQALLQGNFIETGSNPLIDRRVFDEVGGFDPSFRLVADWEMWLRLALRYQFVVVPEVQISFRNLPNALAVNTPQVEKDGRKLFTHVFSQLPTTYQPLHTIALGNFYEFLASRTLKGKASSVKGSLALAFLGKAVRNCPGVLFRKSARIFLVLTKSLACICLPNKQVNRAMTVYRRKIV